MPAVALSFDEDVPARQPFRRSPRCAAVPPPSANDNHRTRCTVTRLFKAPRAPRFGAWGPSGELLAESDETGVVKREYVYLGNLPVAQVDGATGEVFYIHADHLGTPQAVTDALGQLAWEDAYQPFGTATNTGAATAVAMDLRFPGQRLDAETGYHYNYFRDYDPTLGRYLQSDPIGLAGGLNTYIYASANPANKIDPDGLQTASPPMVGGPLPIYIPPVAQPGSPENQAWKDFASPYVNNVMQNAGDRLRFLMTTAILPHILMNEAVDEEPEQCEVDEKNTNPYDGPVDRPVIVVDDKGNAIPVDEGESITSSPDGTWQQVRDPHGNPTGTRVDGGHNPNTHSDPRAQRPHAHVPGVTNTDGTPWLPR